MCVDKLGILPSKPSSPPSINWTRGPRKGRLVAPVRV